MGRSIYGAMTVVNLGVPIPLGARINPKHRRIIPFDIGVYQRILNLDISNILLSDDFDTINKGAVAEIFVRWL